MAYNIFEDDDEIDNVTCVYTKWNFADSSLEKRKEMLFAHQIMIDYFMRNGYSQINLSTSGHYLVIDTDDKLISVEDSPPQMYGVFCYMPHEWLELAESLNESVFVVELDRFIDNSINAVDHIKLEKLEAYGFDFTYNRMTLDKNVEINFIDQTIKYTNKPATSTLDDVLDIASDFFVEPTFFRHEATHSTHIMLDSVQNYLVDHHYYHQEINPEFNKHVDAAIDHLYKAYNAAGLDGENEVRKFMRSIHRR